MSVKKEQIATLIKEGASFTTLDNRAINLIGIAEAIGIWVYLAAKPPNWKVIPAEVQASLCVSRRKYHDAMRRLREIGLVSDKYVRNECGVITGRQVVITNMMPVPQIPIVVTEAVVPHIPLHLSEVNTVVRSNGMLLIKKESTNKEREVITKTDGAKAPRSRKQKKVDPLDVPIPMAVDEASWRKWVQYKLDSGKPITNPGSITENFNLLAEHTVDQQQAMVRVSMRSQWTGLFPYKEESQGRNGNRQSHVEQISEATCNPDDWADNETFRGIINEQYGQSKLN